MHVPLKNKDMHGAKTRHTGRLLLKKEAVAPSDKHGWIDPIDTVEAGETASVLAVQESMRVFVPARMGGPLVSCVRALLHTCNTNVSYPAVRLWFEAC